MLPHELPQDTIITFERAVFKLSGEDAIRYLNGQCTQDVQLATDTTAVYALVTNFKGKLDGDCYIRKHEGNLLIDAPIELREELFTRLDRYIIADDAELVDISDSYAITHHIDPTTSISGWACIRFGQHGVDSLYPKGDAPQSNTSSEEIEKSRITHRIPKWGAELDNDTLPSEADLEDRAISYTKGCYTGQEVISRMRSAGKTNRHLVLLESKVPFTTGAPLLCDGASEEKPAGNITSSCEIDGKQIALAYRKRKYQDISEFSVSGNLAKVI